LGGIYADKWFVSSLWHTNLPYLPSGRVKVISTYSEERTLLLPSPFPRASDIVDLKASGNRLAGVTSDGGFVVWELPPVITGDDLGKLLLSVVPPLKSEALKSVQWYPDQSDIVAAASDSKIYLIDLTETFKLFSSNPIDLVDLEQLGSVITLASVSARNV
jgi:WD40 repeat protein